MRVALGMRGDYGVRAMLALARAEPGGRPMSVRAIAEEMDIPVRFLPHVMNDLVHAGLVTAAVGRGGGYRLARPATAVTVLDVVDVVEPDDTPARCVLRGGPCRPDGRCAVHDVFGAATAATRQALAARSLAEIALTDLPQRPPPRGRARGDDAPRAGTEG